MFLSLNKLRIIAHEGAMHRAGDIHRRAFLTLRMVSTVISDAAHAEVDGFPRGFVLISVHISQAAGYSADVAIHDACDDAHGTGVVCRNSIAVSRLHPMILSFMLLIFSGTPLVAESAARETVSKIDSQYYRWRLGCQHDLPTDASVSGSYAQSSVNATHHTCHIYRQHVLLHTHMVGVWLD
jgi:hypothetical protein